MKTFFNGSPRDLRRAYSLLLIYLFIYFNLFPPHSFFFDCGTDFLIIRLRITRPVGRGWFFILSHQTIWSLSRFVHSGCILFFFFFFVYWADSLRSECSTTQHVRVTLSSSAAFSLTPDFCIKAEPSSKEIQYTLGCLSFLHGYWASSSLGLTDYLPLLQSHAWI